LGDPAAAPRARYPNVNAAVIAAIVWAVLTAPLGYLIGRWIRRSAAILARAEQGDAPNTEATDEPPTTVTPTPPAG
jgi:hypothetical protein